MLGPPTATVSLDILPGKKTGELDGERLAVKTSMVTLDVARLDPRQVFQCSSDLLWRGVASAVRRSDHP